MLRHIFKFFIIIIPTIVLSQTQIGLDIDGEAQGDQSGSSVSVSSDGSIVAIGAFKNGEFATRYGHVRIYENIGGDWTQVGTDIDGEGINDESGSSVSISSDGSVIAIGAQFNSGTGFQDIGHVRVYKNVAGTWTQVGSDIDGESANDLSGSSVSLSADGSIVAIGAPFNDANGNNSGHVRVYKNIGDVWTQIGSDIDGEMAEDHSGKQGNISLSADGSIIAVGANRNDGSLSNAGHVRIFENIGDVWTQIGSDIEGEAIDDYSGLVSLSDDGSTVAIGALYNDDNGVDSGHVRVFENIGNVWTQIGSNINGEAGGDRSGFVSLSANGSILAVGAFYNMGSGHVRVYKNIGGIWTQIGSDIDGEAGGDRSGYVSLSSNGLVLAVGATHNDGNGSNSGHVRMIDLSSIVLSTESFEFDYFTVYPNPVKDTFNIKLAEGLILDKINIYNRLGAYLESTKDLKIDSSKLSSGIYFIEVLTNKGKSGKKIIIE